MNSWHLLALFPLPAAWLAAFFGNMCKREAEASGKLGEEKKRRGKVPSLVLQISFQRNEVSFFRAPTKSPVVNAAILFVCSPQLWACATDETKLCRLSLSAKQHRKSCSGPQLYIRIWVRAMIGLLKKPLSICQSGWKEIRNAFPVILWVRWEPRKRYRRCLPGLNYLC